MMGAIVLYTHQRDESIERPKAKGESRGRSEAHGNSLLFMEVFVLIPLAGHHLCVEPLQHRHPANCHICAIPLLSDILIHSTF